MNGKIQEFGLTPAKGFLQKYRGYLIYFSYLAFFALLFWPFSRGGGNFWDWNVPYFSEHLKNYANNYSWQDYNLGAPLGYASSMYVNKFFSFFGYLRVRPEFFLFFILTIPASFSAYLTFLLAKRLSANNFFALILGLAVVLNPAYFYKIMAGHTVYLISFSILIFLIYFLFSHFKKDLRSSLILGLLLAFVGAQTQFFIFALILLLPFAVIFREKFSLKYLSLAFVVVLAVNLPWLLNFINGALNVSAVAGAVKADAFSELSHGSIVYILTLLFTKATLIQNYYPKLLLMFFFGLSVIALYSIIIGNKNKDYYFIAIGLVISAFGLTGLINYLSFFPFNIFSSIVREVGHFAPIFVLFIILIIAHSYNRQLPIFKKLGFIYLTGFLVANLYIFESYIQLPKPNFEHIRGQFANFERQNNLDESTFRILTYPFFGQYSFNDVAKSYVGGKEEGALKNNSGWDNFMNNAGKEVIINSTTVSSFDTSLQYGFAKDHDLSKLENAGVKYIYDFSDIYESNIERYIPASLYNNDLNIIKNPNLIKQLSREAPDRLQQLSPNIYRLNRTKPRIFLEDQSNAVLNFEKIDPTLYKVTIDNLDGADKLTFLSAFNLKWQIVQAEKDIACTAIESSSVKKTIECRKEPVKLLTKLFLAKKKVLFGDSHTRSEDGYNQWEIRNDKNGERISFYIYFAPQTAFSIASYFGYLVILTVLVLIAVLRKKDLHNRE